jgi:hypothetical protein
MSPPADLSLTVAGGASDGAARPAVVGRASVEDFDYPGGAAVTTYTAANHLQFGTSFTGKVCNSEMSCTSNGEVLNLNKSTLTQVREIEVAAKTAGLR